MRIFNLTLVFLGISAIFLILHKNYPHIAQKPLKTAQKHIISLPKPTKPSKPFYILYLVPKIQPSPAPSPAHRSRNHLPAKRHTPHNIRYTTRTIDVTAYCWTGSRAANGQYPYIGSAASNTYPFGTKLDVPGVGVVTITDRIGHGTDLDIYLGKEGCEKRASNFGRRHLRVSVLK